MHLVGLIHSSRILTSFFTILLIKIGIFYPLIILICLGGRFLLRLYIFKVFDGFSFLVTLIKILIAQCLTLCIILKVDLLAFEFVWQVDWEILAFDLFDFLSNLVFIIFFLNFLAIIALDLSTPLSLFTFIKFSVL